MQLGTMYREELLEEDMRKSSPWMSSTCTYQSICNLKPAPMLTVVLAVTATSREISMPSRRQTTWCDHQHLNYTDSSSH